METMIRAKFHEGVIEPLEKLELEDGTEINVIISVPLKIKDALNAFRATTGAWKGTIDAEKLKKDIYSDRLVSTRPEPTL